MIRRSPWRHSGRSLCRRLHGLDQKFPTPHERMPCQPRLKSSQALRCTRQLPPVIGVDLELDPLSLSCGLAEFAHEADQVFRWPFQCQTSLASVMALRLRVLSPLLTAEAPSQVIAPGSSRSFGSPDAACSTSSFPVTTSAISRDRYSFSKWICRCSDSTYRWMRRSA